MRICWRVGFNLVLQYFYEVVFYVKIMMENITIKLLLKSADGTVLFVEFMEDGKSKILSYQNFIARYGAAAIKSI